MLATLLLPLLFVGSIELTSSPAVSGENLILDVRNGTEENAWTGLIFSLVDGTCDNQWGTLLCYPYVMHGFPLIAPADHWVTVIPMPVEFSGFEFWVQAASGFALRGPSYSNIEHCVIR